MRPCRPSPRFALLALSLIAATAALVATTSGARPETAATSRPRPVSAGLPLLFEPTAAGSLVQARYVGASGGESVRVISATEFTTTLLGTTSSSDLPTRGALQSTRDSAQDGYQAPGSTKNDTTILVATQD